MESDSFFFQFFKQLPGSFFELIDAVEVKKSFRIDGVFLPIAAALPVYFVEVQFRRREKFYANLFAKVFCFLEENNPAQEWVAVAIFPTRKVEPQATGPYADLLGSNRVKRIYLDDLSSSRTLPLNLAILRLVTATKRQTRQLVADLMARMRAQYADSEIGRQTIELTEELLVRKYSEMNREEIRKMFDLADLRKTRVWQESYGEGKEEGKEETKQELVAKWLSKGMSHKQIADLLEVAVPEVRRLAKASKHGD